MANAGAKLSSFPEVNDIQTGDMFPLLSGGNTNAKIDYATLADAIIAKLKSEAGDGVLSINGKTGAVNLSKADVGLGNVDNTRDADKHVLANNIQWGGPVLNDTVSPIDAGLSSIHAANRLAFCNPDGITIEYSNDGGSTWADYGDPSGAKIELVTSGGKGTSWFNIGKRSSKGTVTINDKLRVTFNAYKCGVYTAGVRLLLNLATNGASGSNVTLETSPNGDATTFSKVGTYPVSGWSGWNSIPINFRFGGWGIDAFRLTFGITGLSSNTSDDNIFQVGAIFLYGTSAWATPSNMAFNNHIYSFDYKQDAIFPAQITATKFNGPATTADSATKATQDASGNVITSTYATKGELNGHVANISNPHAVTKGQIGLANVANLDQSKAIKSITRSGTTFTATALDGTTTTFTQQDSNTTYSVATSSADGLMSKSDKAKLDGISSGADVVTIKTVKVNGTALTPDSDKAVNVTVPTLANNATTTAGGMALDARMGKTLSDQASQLAKNTAQIETAGTATNAHSVGEYVMISNALYKVTASVAKGDTWTIGTNVTAASVGNEIASLKSNLANHSALHVLPLSDIADAQNGFSITNCNVAIQGKIVLCWLSFGMNNITIPTWTDFAIAKLKSGYYPAKTRPHYLVGIIQEQTSGLTGALQVIDNAIKINTHGVSFNSAGWCWGFIAYVLA